MGVARIGLLGDQEDRVMTPLLNRNDRRPTLVRTCALVALCACAPSVGAQDTRAELIATERAARAQEADAPGPGGPGWAERIFSWGESRLGDAAARDGFHPEMGGMIPGTGLSVGPGYRVHLFGTRAIVDASAAVSWLLQSPQEPERPSRVRCT